MWSPLSPSIFRDPTFMRLTKPANLIVTNFYLHASLLTEPIGKKHTRTNEKSVVWIQYLQTKQ